MRYLVLCLGGFGDFQGPAYAAVPIDQASIDWLERAMRSRLPVEVNRAMWRSWPDSIRFFDSCERRDVEPSAAVRIDEATDAHGWAIVESEVVEQLQDARESVDHAAIELWVDSAGAVEQAHIRVGVAFRSCYIEGVTREGITPGLLAQLKSIVQYIAASPRPADADAPRLV
jgi:hypothetical protein